MKFDPWKYGGRDNKKSCGSFFAVVIPSKIYVCVYSYIYNSIRNRYLSVIIMMMVILMTIIITIIVIILITVEVTIVIISVTIITITIISMGSNYVYCFPYFSFCLKNVFLLCVCKPSVVFKEFGGFMEIKTQEYY